MSFTIEPPEALKIQHEFLQRASQSAPALSAPNTPLIDAGSNSSSLANELRRIGRSGQEIDMLKTIARVLVLDGSSRLVIKIAAELESEGNLEAATALRQAISADSSGTNTPLLT
jgi:hypothetical protein